jgi:hypothetical protein
MVAADNATAKKLKHLATQPAAAWHSFITGPGGMPSSSQQSWEDAACISDAAPSSIWTAKAPAIGSTANDSATKKAKTVRPMRMQLLDLDRNIVDSEAESVK